MAKTILHAQEVETFYLIPTLRRYYALILKEHGMKQKDIATLLGISSASISQYTSTKRGHKISFPDNIVNQIKESALRITNQSSYFKEIQLLLQLMRTEKILCQIHRQFSEVPEECDPIAMGCHAR
jgi:predicted transcriptional regulator